MKKQSIFFIGSLIACFLLTACDNKTEDVAYADLSIEQHKTKLQDDGMATLEKLDGMRDLSAISAVQDFMSIMNASSTPEASLKKALTDVVSPIAQLNKKVLSLTKLDEQSISMSELATLFNQNAGIYTYDPTNEAFVKTESATTITYFFPIGASQTNNGKIIIDNFSEQLSTNPERQDAFPKTLQIKLIKDNVNLFSFSWNATYNIDMIPTNLTANFSFKEGYEFNQNLTSSASTITWNMAYKLNNSTILSSKFSTNGHFTYEDLSNAESSSIESLAAQVVNNGNAWVQLGNIKLTGIVDLINMKAAIDKAFPNDEVYDSEADTKKECELLNKYIKLVVLYADENKAIAKSSFYSQEKTNGYWDYRNNREIWIETTSYSPNMQLVFKDGSAMDESFFAQGFEDLQTAFSNMLTSFQTSPVQ